MEFNFIGQPERVIECREQTCFAYRDGRCNALENTDFGRRRCPFYKYRGIPCSDRNCVKNAWGFCSLNKNEMCLKKRWDELERLMKHK